uniref:DNA mismatch repair protein MLH3-like protein n=1 Tax=Solanum tuberosum TaxID=4113 RepID=A0A0X7YCF6_SOLTU|nr:DNA mismatch repair protein MLH3-like protein [Solanum tuberosum]
MPMPNSSANMQEEFHGYYFQCFYNQPVRRKQMRSSEDDLLCPRASPSLLPLLFSGLGIHLRSLNKLNASDGSFKLSGNISAMLFSRVDGNSHKWIDAGNRGKTDELIRKKKSSRNHSSPPFYQVKNKFFAMGESTRKAAGNHSIKTVHDVPLMLETRAKLSAGSFHSSHPINVINLPPQVVGMGFSVMKFNVIQFLGRPSVKREFVNIWNSKLQAQGECTWTHDGELKEEFAPTKTKNFIDSGIQWRDFRTLQLSTLAMSWIVTPGVLHFVGDSLVPDTIDKNFPESAKVLQQVGKKFIPIVASTTPDITDQPSLHQVSVSIGIGTRYVKVNDNASVFSLELMIVDKMLVHQILFIASSEDDVVCTHSSSSLLPLLSGEFGIYQSEVDLLCTRASPSPLPLLFGGLGFSKGLILFIACSEVDLFCTRASPSPLPLLSSGFGSHLSSLNKLNARDGSFKLSGYISCPDVYTMKLNPSLFIFFEGCELESFPPWMRFRISASGPYFSTSPTLREKWPYPINDIFPANLLSASMQKPLSFRSILLHKLYSQRKMADAIAVFSQQRAIYCMRRRAKSQKNMQHSFCINAQPKLPDEKFQMPKMLQNEQMKDEQILR